MAIKDVTDLEVYNSIQENPALQGGNELNADMSSSLGKPRLLRRGGRHNLGLELLEPLYKLASIAPSSHRKLKYQLVEAAEKIPPQIAEGFGKKKSAKEFCRFLSMALGSSDEIITHIRELKIVAKNYQRIDSEECDYLIDKYKLLSKKLNKLLSSWQRFT